MSDFSDESLEGMDQRGGKVVELMSILEDAVLALENEEVQNALTSIHEAENTLEKNNLYQIINNSSRLNETLRTAKEYIQTTTEDNMTSADFERMSSELRNELKKMGVKPFSNSDLGRIDELEKRIERKEKSLEEERRRSRDILEELKNQRDKISQEIDFISNKKGEIDEALQEAKKLEETQSNLVQLNAAESIGGHFENRKEQLEDTLRWWKVGSILSILLLLGFSGIIYLDVSSTSGQNLAVLSKVALILPVSVAVWFTVSNYSHQKKLMEEYEFKANVALSLMGFREVVEEALPEDEQELLGEFVIDTMDKIYSNPQENITNADGQEDQNTPLTSGQGTLANLIKK